MLGRLPSPDITAFWDQLDDACYRVCEKYQTTAPAVADWADFLLNNRKKDLTWGEIQFLVELDQDDVPPSFAQNLLYKLKYRLGQDTTGMIDH
ncbi:hypothetical protein LQF76_11010 [Gloeomargaritales cyanobacterium VI4D9]|nr:hypothetical protein LQF76_11010 [Gloeomargaritales cyanobacterium VI4D9]